MRTIYTGDVLGLSPDDQVRVAESLIRSNSLYIAPGDLIERFEAGRLVVRYDTHNRVLEAATGFKPLCPRVRDRLLTAPDGGWSDPSTVRAFLGHVAAGRVMEKGWGFNCGDQDEFRHLNRLLFCELRGLGYGLHQVFALVREGNDRARAHVRRLGFTEAMRVPSPYSGNTLVVYVLAHEFMSLAE